MQDERRGGTAGEVLRIFTRLGLTSFGGPIAHLGYFREEFVTRRRWIDDAAYADLVALCQFLPGPASSQVGFAIGLGRAGWLGGLAAWTGFTLPSAVALTAFAYGARGSAAASARGCCMGSSWSRSPLSPKPCSAWRAPFARTRRARPSPSSRCSSWRRSAAPRRSFR